MRGKIKVVISVLMVMTIILGMIGCGEVSTCTVTVIGGTGGGTVDMGSSVTVTADEIEESKAFAGWTDGDGKVLSTENPYTFKAVKDITLTATVKDRELVPLEDTVYYTVVVDGGIIVGADGNTQFEKGEEITVHAVPPEFTEFDYWSVDGESYSTQAEFAHVVMGNIKFTAAFTSLSRFELSLIGCTSESEYVGGVEYVTVTANELENYKFKGWKVNNISVAETGETYEFALEEDTVVEAIFKRINISVTATSTQPDLVDVTVTGDTDGVFEEGDTVTVSAATKNGITVTWRDTEGTLLSRNNPYAFTASDDIELVAHFNSIYTVTVIGGLVNGKTIEVFGSGGEARVEAEIDDGDMFVSWTNEDESEIISTANPYIFFVSSNVVLKAHTKEINENEKTFIFEAENADLSQCTNVGGGGGNTFGTDANINYGSTISNPEDYKPSNNSWAGNFNNRAGNKITWTIMSDSVSTAVFVIRMSNGVWNNNDSSKDMDITPSKLKMIMNGTAISYTPFMIEARNFAGTGASANAALKMFIDYTVSLELPIQAGVNTFVLELVTTGSGPNVDCLRFTTDANLSWVAPNTAGAPLPDYPWYL